MTAAARRTPRALLPSLASWQAWLIAPVIILLVAGVAKAQETLPQAPRAYDICSVKPSPGETSSFRRDPGGGFTATGINAVGLVVSAFDVHDFQVLGLPRWATTDDYDVACKDTQPNDGKPPNSRVMSGIEALLADRFRLRYHREARPLPVATLRIAKSGLKVAPSKGNVRIGGYGPRSVHAEGWSVGDLASALTSLTHEKIIDKTGLTGLYDFDLAWTPEDTPLPDVPLMANVLSDRLGLTITRTVESTEVIVVDRIEKPAGN